MNLSKSILFFSCLFFIGLTLINAQLNITFRANLKYPGQTCANVWGYVDSLGNEYALVGASKGLSIVNVTNPDAPFEVVQIPGPDNLWKEVRTWGKYAYVVSEGGSGLQIIDLSKLPSTTIPNKFWQPTYDTKQLVTAHTLHIDNGFAYLYGGTFSGALICDLADPWNPTVAGLYSTVYIHDGFVRDNKIYGAHIYAGYFSIIDVSNKATPTLLKTHNTPNNFTHNTWLSDDSKTVFTTDEVSNSFLAAYDISDINNIMELDRVQSNPGTNSKIHNCHVKDDYVVCSYYTDGVVVFDGHRPNNLVEVANYDTSPSGSGAWGAYPYLPSGTLLVSDIDRGLFVLSPVYQRACYLEGLVTDSITGLPINTANIKILSTTVTDSTKLTGNYAVGTVTPGTYSVEYSKQGYITQVISGVTLASGVATLRDVKLKPISSFVNNINSVAVFNVYPNPIKDKFSVTYSFNEEVKFGAHLLLTDIAGRVITERVVTNKEGLLSIDNQLQPGVYLLRFVNGDKASTPLRIVKMIEEN